MCLAVAADRLCPAEEELTEECFQRTHLDFVQDKQALLFRNGSRLGIAAHSVYVSQGTYPPNSMWTRIPIPSSGLGPRCMCADAPTLCLRTRLVCLLTRACPPRVPRCDMDNDYHPGDFDCGCKMGEQYDGCTTPGNCSSGACLPCPETEGSDCSRCANPPPDLGFGRYMFPPPCDDECMSQRPSVVDVVKVPAGLKPGKYVLGFRYDCDSTAQVSLYPAPSGHDLGYSPRVQSMMHAVRPLDRAGLEQLRRHHARVTSWSCSAACSGAVCPIFSISVGWSSLPSFVIDMISRDAQLVGWNTPRQRTECARLL